MIRKAGTLSAILAGVLLLLSWWSPHIDPRKFWPAAFMGLFFPYLYIVCLLIAALGLLFKKHRAWLMILVLIICINLFRKSFINFSIPSSQGNLKILTHNIGSSLKGNKKPQWMFYTDLGPDILCFQEWHSNSPLFRIKDSLENRYYHTKSSRSNFWPVFSKYPILRQGELLSKAPGNGCTWADIQVQQNNKRDTIRVYNVHLVSNKISDQTEQLMQTRDLPDKSTWHKIKRVMQKYRKSLHLRVNQAIELKKHMNQSPYPVVLAGDFNDIPASYVYRLLHSNLNDAFIKKGNGLAYTYAGKLPFLHIDNILTSRQIMISNLEIKRVNYSDHYPVLATILVK